MLRGERVVLRPVEKEDLKRLHDLGSNVELEMLAGSSWEPVPLAAFEKEFEKHLEGREKSDFVIEVDGTVIGEIGLHEWRNRRAGSASFGVSIRDPEYLGKGYGREAIDLLLDWSFRIMNYRRIHLETLANNERAVRCYRACGFVEEGRLRQHEYYNGSYADVLVMGILRDEWESRRKAG
jgi:RimJ/RimL family protein N-acetyltransferase